jgi:signal peptidase II
MFYFPLINTRYPEWFPFWGGNQLIFFRPVFNIADSCITIGIFSILIFYRKYFNKEDKKQSETDKTENEELAPESLN